MIGEFMRISEIASKEWISPEADRSGRQRLCEISNTLFERHAAWGAMRQQ